MPTTLPLLFSDNHFCCINDKFVKQTVSLLLVTENLVTFSLCIFSELNANLNLKQNGFIIHFIILVSFTLELITT